MQKTVKPLVLTRVQLMYLLVLLQSTSGNDLHKELQDKIEQFLLKPH